MIRPIRRSHRVQVKNPAVPASLSGAAVLLTALLAWPAFSEPLSAQSLSAEKQHAMEAVDGLSAEIEHMAQRLWDYSETALLEYESAEFLAALLQEDGFTVERGLAGMPTAFVAEFGSGHPVIGILAEFDALPGVGNAPEPNRAPRLDGITSGQGCGHNLFGAGSVGAAMALKRVMERDDLQGTIRLYGTPAEETVVGKVYMAKAGVFDDLDVALDWHPGQENQVSNSSSQAMNNFTVEFFGQAAHSAADPWNGRSALDAVEMMNFGVNLMREHIKPSARIHYVIQSGGEAPNVVPEYAKVWYYVRDLDRASVEDYYARILDIATGAAMATRTEHKVTLTTGVHAYLLNRPLQEAMQANLETVGAPAFSEEDQAWGRQLQEFLDVEPTGFPTEIEPLADEPKPASGGSTDVAEVSRIAPVAAFSIATAPPGVPWHSWATSASHGTAAGKKGAEVAARVLALTGVDLLTNPELVAEARTFFEEAMGGEPYVSPIPVDQAPPLPESGGR
jgi:aminobenzoyl-glutamate utilization protein B